VIPLWLKILNTQNEQLLPVRKVTNIPVTFKGDSALFPNLTARWCQGQRTRFRHFPFSDMQTLTKTLKNYYMGRRVFSRRCGPESVVRSPQSAVRSPQSLYCAVWCLLHNVVGEPLTESVKFLSVLFRALWSQCFEKQKINIVFPRQKHSFCSCSKYGLVWTQKWCKIFYLKMNRNISRGLNMLTQFRSYEPPKCASSLKDIPQFFAQVSNFDITC